MKSESKIERSKVVMTVVSGTAYWASVTAPNTMFDVDGVYTIDIASLMRRIRVLFFRIILR